MKSNFANFVILAPLKYDIIDFVLCGSRFWATWTRFIKSWRAATAKLRINDRWLYGKMNGSHNQHRKEAWFSSRLCHLKTSRFPRFPWSQKTLTRCFEIAVKAKLTRYAAWKRLYSMMLHLFWLSKRHLFFNLGIHQRAIVIPKQSIITSSASASLKFGKNEIIYHHTSVLC